MKRLFLFPTEMEAAKFRQAAPEADIRISGVGVSETAVTLAKVLREDWTELVLAGTAGAYNEMLEIGATVAVSEERPAGLPSDFSRVYPAGFVPDGLRPVVSNTVARSGAEAGGALIENMEGAVFFAMCSDAGVRFCEVRTVSNRVGAPREEWQMERAVDNLAQKLVERFIKKEVMENNTEKLAEKSVEQPAKPAVQTTANAEGNNNKLIVWGIIAVVGLICALFIHHYWVSFFRTVFISICSIVLGYVIGRYTTFSFKKKNK